VSAARYKLGDAWVRPEQLDGTESNSSGIMAISKAVFLEKYLIPKVKASLRQFVFPPAFGVSFGFDPSWTGPEPTRDNLTWTFKQEITGANVTEVEQALDALTVGISQEVAYDRAVTDVHSSVDEVLALRAGGCQDFAHLFIAVARAMGVPARYVSGYLSHRGADDRWAADATHPWGAALRPPLGWVGFVSFGGERVRENAELSSFYSPGGGIAFFTAGHSPVSLEILSAGKYSQLNGGGGFGPKLFTKVPPVASVPGAPFASVESIKVKAGSAMKRHGKPVYYGTVPSGACHGGLKIKTEVTFAENGDESKPITVPASYTAPCPRKS